jgi:hypothetical protein
LAIVTVPVNTLTDVAPAVCGGGAHLGATGGAAAFELAMQVCLRYFEPIDEGVNVGASAGQLLPQDANRVNDFAIGAGAQPPQQRRQFWYQRGELVR